jgi:predicted DNA-binding WGR domain protein
MLRLLPWYRYVDDQRAVVRQWQRRGTAGGHTAQPAAQQDVIQLAIRFLDWKREVPCQ